MIKKFISFFTSFILVTGILFNTNVFANEISNINIDIIDDLLRKANTPEDKIKKMDNELKKHIYENSLSKKEVKYVDITEEQNNNIARVNSEIPDSNLKLSVTAFKVYGKQQIDIYTSYEWLTPVKPKGKDYFGYSTHQSFSAVPGERSNLIWVKLNKNDSWFDGTPATYTGTSIYGYEHKGSSLGTPDFPIYLKGSFYYKADIDSSSPVNKIVLAYVHDTSYGSNFSYGVGYGPFSISITPSSNNVKYKNGVFELNY